MSASRICTRLLAACFVALVGCEEDDVTAPRADLVVTLDEFSVTPSRSSVEDGAVRFTIENEGTEVHEFVVVKTDLAADALPMNADGSFDEDGPGVEVVDEIEEIRPNETANLTLSLVEGHYVVLCNRVEVEDDEVEPHYAMGMRANLDVD